MCGGDVPAAVGQGQHSFVEQRDDEIAVLSWIRAERLAVVGGLIFAERKLENGAASRGDHLKSAIAKQLFKTQPEALPALP